MNRKPSLLFMDDERCVLKGIERMLHRQRSRWDMHFCSTPAELQQLLDHHSFDVAIVDMRMPDMDGVEVLNRIRRLMPGCIRIILSGQSSEESRFEVVDVAHQFLSKPCEADRLCQTLERALSLSQLITDPSVRQLVTEVGILPSVPRIYQQFEQLLKSDHCDCDAVSHLVSQDPALSAKLLKVVNTAFFGLPKEVVSITDAINFMGYEKIKSLVLVTELFQQVDQAILQRFDLDRIWMQAMQAQTLAKRLAPVAGVSASELEQINAALMFQGIGELAVAAQAPDRYQTILEQVEKEGLALSEAEQVVLNASHIHLSVFMLGVWGLPLPLLELTLLLLEPPKMHTNSAYALLFASHFLTLGDTEKQLEKFTDQGFPEAWLECAEECLGYERG